jgi:hypothetical protein
MKAAFVPLRKEPSTGKSLRKGLNYRGKLS